MAAIRAAAKEIGRNPAEILMFSMMTIILGRTEAEAKAKYADYRRHIAPEGALALMSGWIGVDFSTYDLDQEVRHVQNDAGRTAPDNVTRRRSDDGSGPCARSSSMSASAAPAPSWSARPGEGRRRYREALVRADRRRRPQRRVRHTSPGATFEDIADMLVPELTRRGRYKSEYAKGTLREKLFGAGRARLSRSSIRRPGTP